jgi:hypothetical protein
MTKFEKRIWEIHDEKFQKLKELIVEAIGEGVHVDILVNSAPGEVLAWELWEGFGFPQGTSEFTHVLRDQSENAEPGHLRLQYCNIVTRRM